MHALVYLDCSFTRCYTLVDEAEKRRQFSVMNDLTSATAHARAVDAGRMASRE